MKRNLVLAGKLTAFVVGAYFSDQHCYSYGYVGPIFGLVVLLWQARSWRDLLQLRSLAFLAASTLIYMLVFWLVKHEKAALTGDSSLLMPVLVGTMLLPLAHGLLLGPRWPRVLVAVPGIYLTWYGIILGLSRLHGAPAWLEPPVLDLVSVWQAAYLVFLFTPSPKRFSMVARQTAGSPRA